MEPVKKSLVTAASIMMRADIVTSESGLLRGELHSIYLDPPYVFTTLLKMIEKMEEVFDTKGFPEAFMKPRSFGNEQRRIMNMDAEGDDDMKDSMDQILAPESGSNRCTFEITVKFRQNATWQGQILWAEKDKRQNFRSVLEMLKLMDEALLDGAEDTQSVVWDS